MAKKKEDKNKEKNKESFDIKKEFDKLLKEYGG